MTPPHASAPQPPRPPQTSQPPQSPQSPALADAPPFAPDSPPFADAPAGPTRASHAGPAVRVACGAEIELRLVTGPGGEIPFPARLTYTQADPYAVRLHCQTGPSSTVTWVLSRDTLRHGLDRPSGLGDVRVRPAPGPGADGQGTVLITLGSGREAALLRGDTAEIQRFLRLSAAVVPLGTEHRHLDIDGLVSRLRPTP